MSTVVGAYKRTHSLICLHKGREREGMVEVVEKEEECVWGGQHCPGTEGPAKDVKGGTGLCAMLLLHQDT